MTASQVLLSPPPPRTMSYICDWTQAIRCEYPNLKPLQCQREGCNNTRLVMTLVCDGSGSSTSVRKYRVKYNPVYDSKLKKGRESALHYYV